MDTRNNITIDLQKFHQNCFNNSILAQIILWISANKQMTLETITRVITNFKNGSKKTQYLQNQPNFDYSPYFLRQIPQDDKKQQKKHEQFFRDFKNKFADSLDEINVASFSNVPPSIIIEQKFNQILSIQKSKYYYNVQQENSQIEENAKYNYLKKLIEKILQIFGKNDQNAADKILNYGNTNIAYCDQIFRDDPQSRTRFNNILNNCKTFIQYISYGNTDIEEKKKSLVKSLKTQFFNLGFTQKIINQISIQYLKDPFSHIIALHKDLAQYEKERFYKSKFNQNKVLLQYFQKINYQDSLDSKVKSEINLIFKTIDQNSRVNPQALQHILNISFFQILKLSNYSHIQKQIYDVIVNKCPNFFKASQLVRYQNKKPNDFKINQQTLKKFELRALFFQIRLQFNKWQKVEQKIFNRQYNVIDELSIEREGKYRLIQYIFNNIETYFHSQQKLMNYRSEIQMFLLDQFMNSDIYEIRFDRKMNIINQTLDSQQFISKSVKFQNQFIQNSYLSILTKPKFQQYKNNCKLDIKEIKYQQKQQLFKKIYQINYQNKIDVQYQQIKKFIQYVIQQNDNKIPQKYKTYVVDLPKLKKQPIEEPIQEPVKVLDLKGQEKLKDNSIKKKEEVQKKLSSVNYLEEFKKEALNFIQAYLAKFGDQTKFEKIMKESFNTNREDFIRKIIEKKAFLSSDSPFFNEINLKGMALNNTKKEFTQNKQFALNMLTKCTEILTKISQNDDKSKEIINLPYKSSFVNNNLDLEDLENQFNQEAQIFIQWYCAKQEQSKFEKVMTSLFNNNRADYIKKIINQKAFQSNTSQFFSQINFSGMQLNNTKKQFAKNGPQSINKLTKCCEILAKIQK